MNRKKVRRHRRAKTNKMTLKEMKDILFKSEQSQEHSENDKSVICEQCPYVARNDKMLSFHIEIVHKSNW